MVYKNLNKHILLRVFWRNREAKSAKRTGLLSWGPGKGHVTYGGWAVSLNQIQRGRGLYDLWLEVVHGADIDGIWGTDWNSLCVQTGRGVAIRPEEEAGSGKGSHFGLQPH